ncbi:RNA polymerase sigma factor [bacterium]|nr:RNA polymerase sigma factor [bacterium]
MKHISDHDLMISVKDGDLDKLGVLFERYHQKLYTLFLWQTRNAIISQDLVQEVFMRMLKSNKTYRGEGQFTTWMYCIARSVRMDHYRKNRKKMTSLDQAKEIPMDGSDPELQAERQSEIDLLYRAMDQLSDEKREVLVLSRLQNYKYEEIAGILGCSVGTIKSRVFWAIRDLGKIVKSMNGICHEM